MFSVKKCLLSFLENVNSDNIVLNMGNARELQGVSIDAPLKNLRINI